ncbi:hypothetical protein FACS1894166_05910 [Bacilli bacterium]|nr:hypothetical protein FACS1894166_05910 [Bacilli bacterium]
MIACSAIIPLATSCKVAPTPLDYLTYTKLDNHQNIAITGFQHKYRNETKLNVQPTYKIKGLTYTVTQIGDYDVNDSLEHNNFGFYHNRLKKIILPNTIKKITDFAFAEQRCP